MISTRAHLIVVSANPLLHHSLDECTRELQWTRSHFTSGQDFLANYQPQPDNCLLIDLDLRQISGTELLQGIRLRFWSIPSLVTQAWPATNTVVEAIKWGASGFLEQPLTSATLAQAVTDLFNKLGPARGLLCERTARLTTLTAREREVLELLLAAATTQSIANRLDISPKTVEKHRLSIMAKMRVASIPELFKLWLDCAEAENHCVIRMHHPPAPTFNTLPVEPVSVTQ
jgi:FixJ family two-component response regulator